MAQTNRLGLPYLAAAQSQKHVTHNEALRALDPLVQIAAADRDVNAAPAIPVEGQCLIVGPAPTGEFAGRAGTLAAFDDGAWRFLQPRAGWVAYVVARRELLVHDGTAWQDVSGFVRSLGGLARLGIGTEADATNLFSARLNAALFAARPVAEGGTDSLRIVMNKPAKAATLSQVWQTGWSGRAEVGLAGDDNFRIRASADGSTWRDALVVDPATGAVRFPGGIAEAGGQSLPGLRNQVVNGDFAIAQRGAGPFPLAASAVFGFDRWLVQATGTASATLSRTAFPAGQTDVPGARWSATFAVIATTATSFPEVQTRLEDVARLAGRTVTLSFWYRTTSSAFFVDLAQVFGTGGSAAIRGLSPIALPASAAWTRKSVTLALPALAAGTTVGDGSYTALRFALSGAAAGSISIADVQLEEGPVATTFERRPPAIELLLCRRFFRRSSVALVAADLAAEMRAVPAQTGTGPFDYSAEL